MRTFSSRTKPNTRRNSPRGAHRAAVLLVAALAALYVLRGTFGSGASVVFAPALALRQWFAESPARLPAYLRDRQALISEIEALKQRLAEREDDERRLREIQEENAALNELIGFNTGERITAGVLARPGQIPYDTLLIDRGSEDGVVEGAAVSLGANTVIGTIEKTHAHSALVRLVTAPGTKTTVYIFGPDLFAEAEGMGGGVLRVSVPQGVPLAEGDLVVLPGAGAGVYGEVASVESAESDPRQYAYVTPPSSMQALRFVFVSRAAASLVSYDEALSVIAAARETLFHVDVPAPLEAEPLTGPEGGSSAASTESGASADQPAPEETAPAERPVQ